VRFSSITHQTFKYARNGAKNNQFLIIWVPDIGKVHQMLKYISLTVQRPHILKFLIVINCGFFGIVSFGCICVWLIWKVSRSRQSSHDYCIASGVARKFFRGSKSRGSSLLLPFPPLPSPFPFLSLSLTSLSLPFPSHFPPPFPPLPPLRSRTHKIQLGSLGERCELPQRALGRRPSRNQIWCIIALKYEIWWQQF